MSHTASLLVIASGLALAAAGVDEMGPLPAVEPQCQSFEVETYDVDVAGELLFEKWGATVDSCCDFCEKVERCVGFVFYEQTCYLKAAFAGTLRKVGAVSRLKSNLGSSVEGFIDRLQGKDLIGDLLEAWSAPTPEACCVACAGKPDCQGITFAESMCYLKGNVRGTYDHEGCVVRAKMGVLPDEKMEPQCSRFEVEAIDVDVAGELLAQKWGATVDSCCDLCEEMEGCVGFVHSEQTCYLKASFAGTYRKVGAVSRLKSSLGIDSEGFTERLQDKDLIGDLLESWSSPTAEACCAACAGKPECQGITFVDSMCYLKGNVRGTYDHEGCVAIAKTAFFSYEKSRAQCSRFGSADDYEGYDVSGVLLAQSGAASSDECCPLCEALNDCEAFAFLDYTCYLKGNFTGTYQKAGVVSRIQAGLGAGCPGFSAPQEGKDLAGALLDEWYAPKPDLCCAACANKPDCHGFAFLDEHCYLKGSTHGTYDTDGSMAQVKDGIPLVGGSNRRLGGGSFLV